MRHDGIVDEAAQNPDEAKRAMRASMRARRLTRPADGQAARALASHLRDIPAGTVACFMSMPSEPDTRALIAALLNAGTRVLVPRVDGRDLEWVALSESVRFSPGPFGIREPVGSAVGRGGGPLTDCAAVLLPALAVDGRGFRLGQGGGFYDRTLAEVPEHGAGGPMRIAVVFDDEVVEAVPTDVHDCRVDLALTEVGIRRFSPGA